MSDPPRAGGARLARSFLPGTAVLEMTYRCNHRCLFCSCPWEADHGNFARLPELTVEQWKPVLRRLAEMGVTDLAFTGGEPLLKEGLVELLECAAGCQTEHIFTADGVLQSRVGPPKLFLLSNGTGVDRTILEVCRRLQIQLSMSLPGLATYREHTQAGDPDTVLQNFREAAALGVATVAGITVTRRNLPELYQTIAAAILAGAGSVLLNRFLPGGRGLAHADRLSLSWDETRQMLDVAEQALRDAGRYGNVGTELPRCLLDDPTRYEHLEVGTRCSAVVRFFTIDPSGYVRVCNHSPVRLEPFDRIDAVKTHPYWLRFVRKDYLPAACSGCGAAGDCDGGCREAAHITRGTLVGLDPLFAADPPRLSRKSLVSHGHT